MRNHRNFQIWKNYGEKVATFFISFFHVQWCFDLLVETFINKGDDEIKVTSLFNFHYIKAKIWTTSFISMKFDEVCNGSIAWWRSRELLLQTSAKTFKFAKQYKEGDRQNISFFSPNWFLLSLRTLIKKLQNRRTDFFPKSRHLLQKKNILMLVLRL